MRVVCFAAGRKWEAFCQNLSVSLQLLVELYIKKYKRK